ncbi:MAG: HDOD domain-containing protein, partial [Desulfomonilia bacterium]
MIDDTAAMDRSLDTLAPLEIELEKVMALGGRLSLVVIPREYAEKALKSKRGIDTTVIYKEYVVIGVFGADADEANGMFLSVPKGMAMYPRDGSDIQRLFFEAVERLRHSRGSSPWVTQLWDSIRDMKTSEEDTESRFISSSFYQFYAFIADHPADVSRMLHDMTESERHWIMDFLPYDIPTLVSGEDMTEPRDFSKVMDQWQYKDRMLKKQENGKITLRRFRNVEHLFTLPSISKEIMDLAGDPLLAASRMAKIIEKDPVLTSRLLKVVNSAFYGFRRQIDSVEHAVVILGNEEVVNLAFSIAVHKVLDNVEPLRARNLWEH